MQDEPVRIRVECHAGYRGEEEPRAFTLGARRFEVREVLDRWLDPAHRYFKVRTDDGRVFLIRHDERADRWELAGRVDTLEGVTWH